MNIFPLEDDPIPDGYDGFLISFDEFNAAGLQTQAAAYQVVLDRCIGQHKLHPKTAMVCAGNLMSDGAIVNRLSTAMQSRLIHLELTVNPELWSLWASANHLRHEVISYINHRPQNLHVFDPNHHDKTFASPRTWEFASRIVAYPKMALKNKLPILAGTISESIAREFLTYCEIYPHIPTYAQIKQAPKVIAVPSEPSMLAATSGMIGAHITLADIDQVMPYIHRMPIEFQVFTLKDAVKRTPKLMTVPSVSEWITVNSAHISLGI